VSHDDDRPTLVDLALGQGPAPELEKLRAAVAADPAAAVEFAETRQLLERLRGATVAPTDALPSRLETLVKQSADRMSLRRPAPRTWPLVAGVAAAASAMFALLAWSDPLGLRCSAAIAEATLPATVPVPAATAPGPRLLTAELDRAFDATRRFAPGSPLTEAWGRYQDAGAAARLSQWLSPRNAVAVLRLDHEWRSSATARLEALAGRGQPAAVEERVQHLADELAAAVLGDAPMDAAATGLALRALLAAGTDHTDAIAAAAARLRQFLPELEGGALASALSSLGELAATTGHGDESLRRHGNRLVDEVVAVNSETWSRRRPRLLSPSTPAVEIADAGRFLRIAPAFDVDAERAMVVRLLLAAHLQERRGPADETPDVPTALVYGFGDLLSADERDEIEQRLRTWRPAVLVPDYLALHQFAATREPGCAGYARFQLELRAICGVATPLHVSSRAALCLCLSTSFAADAGGRALAQG
jgi:hypothetical protein